MSNFSTFVFEKISQSPQQRITFAEFMDLVLYHPNGGYYNQVNIGTEGDYFTSANLGSDFGDMLAEQFAEMWEILGKPNRFTIVEMGAGQGLLALDILQYLNQNYTDCFEKLEYVIIEKAAGLVKVQQQRLQDYRQVRWLSWEVIQENSITGCFFSNELVDALPVQQVRVEEGELREIYVTTDLQANLREVTGEISTPAILEYFKQVEIDVTKPPYLEGYRTEVNLAALAWLRTVSSKLNRGYVLTIDYGYTAQRYYNPYRSSGTLQCYYRHQRHDNPYINLGEQDITASVNFTALERQGELCSLEKLGFTQQGLFLMALGLGNRLADLSHRPIGVEELLKRRDALHQLIDPAGLGNFGVLIQSKGLSQEEKARSLQGLRTPI